MTVSQITSENWRWRPGAFQPRHVVAIYDEQGAVKLIDDGSRVDVAMHTTVYRASVLVAAAS